MNSTRVLCKLALIPLFVLVACSDDKPLPQQPTAAPTAGSFPATGTTSHAAPGAPGSGGRLSSAGAGGHAMAVAAGATSIGGAGTPGAIAAGAGAAAIGGRPTESSAGRNANAGGAVAAGAGGTSATGAAAGSGAGGARGDGDLPSGAGGARGDGDPPAATSCSNKPGKLRGKSRQTAMVKGTSRTYILYAPEKLDPNTPVPLLIVPHGYAQSGENMFDITKYPDIAEREGFVAVFPDGGRRGAGPWDVGSGVCGAGTFVPGADDDQAFVDAMIEFAASDQCIDREHIFMSGWSMGGYFSHETACTRNEIRAIGPHSAGTHDLAGCSATPKPVIMFHFDPDGLISYPCGVSARDRWIARNGCQVEDPDVTMVKGGSCEYYKGCGKNAQVAFCRFDIPTNHITDFLAGHAWSGGNPHTFSIAETESAAELAWKFFKTYAW